MLGSELLVRMLEEYGVKHLFGLPGDTSLAFYDALCKSDKLTHIMSRDERHLGYMADAYARVTDTPGVCEVPSGGGVTYLAPAVAEADGSSVPLISFASDVPLSSEEKSALTALDQKSFLSSMTRFGTRITSPDFIPHMVRKGFRTATSGQTGPVHLTLPENVLSGHVSPGVPEKECYAEEACKKYPALRTRPDHRWVEKAAQLLLEAKRPLIIAGGGVLLSRAWNELRLLAEHLSLPVVTTINGKGSIAETSPLALGVMGTNGAKPATNQAVTEADLILALGTRLNSSITMSTTLISPRAKIIQADSNPAQLGNTFKIDVALHGDAKLVLKDLLQAVQEHKPSPRPASDWVRTAKERVEKNILEMKNALANTPDEGPMHPARIIFALEKMLPEDHVLVLDAGYPTPYTSAYYRTKKPGRTVIDPRAQGSLGFSLPAAIGVKIAHPEKTVVGLFGDGSLAMCLGELETVTRLKLPLIYIHFNNSSFGWIQNLQKIYCGARYFSTDFDPSVDYVKVAEGHGLQAFRANNSHELETVLGKALQSERATFIEVTTPTAAQLTPLVAPWLRDEAKPDEDRARSSY